MNLNSPKFVAALITLTVGSQAIDESPEAWRRERRIIDLHMHIDAKEDRYARAVRIMDAAGIGVGVNLSGGTVTRHNLHGDTRSKIDRIL